MTCFMTVGVIGLGKLVNITIALKEADEIRLSLPLSGSVKEVDKGIKIALGHPTPREIE